MNTEDAPLTASDEMREHVRVLRGEVEFWREQAVEALDAADRHESHAFKLERRADEYEALLPAPAESLLPLIPV